MNTIQAEIRIDVQALSKAFLWALSSPDEGIRQEQLEKAMSKFADFDDNLDALSKVVDDTTAINAVSQDLKTVEANGKTLGSMFTDGSSSEDIFYYFNDVNDIYLFFYIQINYIFKKINYTRNQIKNYLIIIAILLK